MDLAVVAVDDAADDGAATVDGHAQCVDDQVDSLAGIDGPADDPARIGVQDHAAVKLALAGGVFGVGSDDAVRPAPGVWHDLALPARYRAPSPILRRSWLAPARSAGSHRSLRSPRIAEPRR